MLSDKEAAEQELAFVPMSRGAKGDAVKRVQEWLLLNDVSVEIDGVFGERTQQAVSYFQRTERLPADGYVGEETWRALTRPMRDAWEPKLGEKEATLRLAVSMWASKQINCEPREVGGQNRGPWVRFYCGGRDGVDMLWCAAFACWVLARAAETVGKTWSEAYPFVRTSSCDALAHSAEKAGRLVRNPPISKRPAISPSNLFLLYKPTDDRHHAGIFRASYSERFFTYEGNTDLAGGSNGGGAFGRQRKWDDTRPGHGVDVVMIDGASW